MRKGKSSAAAWPLSGIVLGISALFLALGLDHNPALLVTGVFYAVIGIGLVWRQSGSRPASTTAARKARR